MLRPIVRGIIAALLLLVALAAAGIAVAIYRSTLIAWWIYPATALAFAAVTAIPSSVRRIWSAVTGTSQAVFNTLAHIAFVTAVGTCVLFAFNRYGADSSAATAVDVSVARRYTETRYHTRRLNRRTSVRGTPYTVYIIELRLPDGRLKQQEVTLSVYNASRPGAVRHCDVIPGLLGADILLLP